MYDAIAAIFNAKNKRIYFKVPLIDMEALNDCAYTTTNMLNAFHELPLSSTSQEKSSEITHVNAHLKSSGYMPVQEQMTPDNLFGLLRSYGPLIVAVDYEFCKKLGMVGFNKNEGHAVIITGVSKDKVSVIWPSLGEAAKEKYGDLAKILMAQFAGVEIDLANTESTVEKQFNKIEFCNAVNAMTKRGFDAWYYPNERYLDKLRISRTNLGKNVSIFFSRLFSPKIENKVTEEPGQTNHFFSYLILSKEEIEKKGLFKAVNERLANTNQLTKLYSTPPKPSELAQQSDLTAFLLGENAYPVIVEMTIEKELEPAPNTNFIFWRPEYGDASNVSAIFPLDKLTDNMIDEKRKKIKAQSLDVTEFKSEKPRPTSS